MSNGFWDEDTVSGYDLLEDQAQEAEEIAEEYAQAPVVIEADDEELEEVSDAAAFELDQDESSTVYNARLRLEQARLYEMLINHDMFEGVEADPRAVSLVKAELKHYIVKRLEILMGLHQPVEKTVSSSSVFNDIEADFLKQLAYKGTKGASIKQGEAPRPAAKKPSGLKPIGATTRKSTPKPIKKPRVQAPEPTSKSTPESVATPVKKRTKKVVPKKAPRAPKTKKIKNTGVRSREMTAAEIEEMARQDLAEMQSRKPWSKMTASEKIKEIKRVNEKHAKPTAASPEVPPQMTYEEQERKYMMQQAASVNPVESMVNNILQKAKKK